MVNVPGMRFHASLVKLCQEMNHRQVITRSDGLDVLVKILMDGRIMLASRMEAVDDIDHIFFLKVCSFVGTCGDQHFDEVVFNAYHV